MTWSLAIRDILITSMSKGQAPLICITGVVALIIWKMPGGDVSRLVFDIVDRLSDWSLVGYVFFFLTGVGWFFHAKMMRDRFADESRRIGLEKSELQKRVSGVEFESSQKFLSAGAKK
jgi:hypothetical protein